jgi:large subunit ribosomal protein L30
MATLKVKMVKSVIGRPEKQRKVLHGLGLRRINQVVEREDTPAIRGMIHAVQHLVIAEEK